MKKKRVMFILALAVLLAFLFVGVAADLIAPWDPDAVDMANSLAGPSQTHWLGTDHLGRDLLSRLIYGSRSSVFIAFAPVEKPKIALIVYVENGVWGSRYAAPIAGLLIEKYLKGKISENKKALEKQMLESDLIHTNRVKTTSP